MLPLKQQTADTQIRSHFFNNSTGVKCSKTKQKSSVYPT